MEAQLFMKYKELDIAPNFYESPQKKLWTGRSTNTAIEKQYWYQHIQLADLETPTGILTAIKKPDIVLLGYASDEGVRRNSGRIGSKKGPNVLRACLAKLPYHHTNKNVVDFGNIICDNSNLEECQQVLSKVVHRITSKSIFPIIIGGSHDMAYGHFKGIWKTVKDTSKPSIGIVNFDAHFDLRPIENKANSGTPFNQILMEHKENIQYFTLGIQEQSNTKELFDIAKKNNVHYLLNYECDLSNIEYVKMQLSQFIEKNDWIYVTIDMDGFSSAYAPGVSAPSPMGFTPYFVLQTLKFLLDSNKVISCDIAELNPEYDQDNTTANLAARLVDFIVAEI